MANLMIVSLPVLRILESLLKAREVKVKEARIRGPAVERP